MTEPIKSKPTEISVGAGYYQGDTFPGASSTRGDFRFSGNIDYAAYRKPTVKNGTHVNIGFTGGKNFQTANLSLGYGGKVFSNKNESLYWNADGYLKVEHTTSPKAKYINNQNFENQRAWCDETLLHDINATYGGIGINTGLTYNRKNITFKANAGAEYGDHIGLGNHISCIGTKSNDINSLVKEAYAKANEANVRTSAGTSKLKGIFSLGAEYKVSKHFNINGGISYNTSKPDELGCRVGFGYVF